MSTPVPSNRPYPALASVLSHIRFDKPIRPLSVSLKSATLQSSNNAYLDMAASLDSSVRRPTKLKSHGCPEWEVYDGPAAYKNTPHGGVVGQFKAADPLPREE